MTFEELSDSQPNGLHDANLQAFHMDYVQRRLTFHLEIWIGEMAVAERREVYRPAVLIVDDVSFLYVEPPRETKELHVSSSIRINAGVVKNLDDHLQHLRDVGPITCMFLSELNCSIYFAAGRASLEWTGPEDNRS